MILREPALALPHASVRDIGELDFERLRAAGCTGVFSAAFPAASCCGAGAVLVAAPRFEPDPAAPLLPSSRVPGESSRLACHCVNRRPHRAPRDS